jgi:hypothetical protein
MEFVLAAIPQVLLTNWGEIKSGKSEGRKIRGPNKRGCRREKK